jgi:hypothetical protein
MYPDRNGLNLLQRILKRQASQMYLRRRLRSLLNYDWLMRSNPVSR